MLADTLAGMWPLFALIVLCVRFDARRARSNPHKLLREAAQLMPPGPAREAMLEHADQVMHDQADHNKPTTF